MYIYVGYTSIPCWFSAPSTRQLAWRDEFHVASAHAGHVQRLAGSSMKTTWKTMAFCKASIYRWWIFEEKL